ncbi:MAG: flavodoxin-dependent (E)-4-hydroxy-3-methylbut-2-enyl-diphosphate synthase [Clostridia bacterium]
MSPTDNRHIKKEIKIGDLIIGGIKDIAIQSMTNTDTRNVEATIRQIKDLEANGCDIVRISVFDSECADNIKIFKKNTKIPLVADIHYDHRLAVLSIKNGIDKIRINPGNIGSKDKVKEVIDTAREFSVPIRVGVNVGSLPDDLYKKYGGPTVDAVREAVKTQVDTINEMGFDDIVISAKSSDTINTVEIYKMLDKEFNYPLHVGVTEAGTLINGTVKSSIALGILLNEGIGDTIRVSLTDDPVNEVIVAKQILRAMRVRKNGINVISCPTCGRTRIDVIKLSNEIEEKTKHITKNLDIAVMGCAVNGINESKYADIGIAGGDGKAVLFKKGVLLRTIREENIIQELLSEIDKC